MAGGRGAGEVEELVICFFIQQCIPAILPSPRPLPTNKSVGVLLSLISNHNHIRQCDVTHSGRVDIGRHTALKLLVVNTDWSLGSTKNPNISGPSHPIRLKL